MASRANSGGKGCATEPTKQKQQYNLHHKDNYLSELSLRRISIFHLARKRDFDFILCILRNEEIDVSRWLNGCKKSTSNNIATCINDKRLKLIHNPVSRFKGETILHLILQYDPPVEVVDLIIRRLNTTNFDVQHCCDDTLPRYSEVLNFVDELSVDFQGRTPLHIAAALGCSCDVVRRLARPIQRTEVTGFHSSASAVDDMRRYPLHWACTNPRSHERTRSCLPFFELPQIAAHVSNLLIVVQILLESHPPAIMEMDCENCTPLDIAKQNGCEGSIVHMLEKSRFQQSILANPSTNHSSNTSTTKEDSVECSNDCNINPPEEDEDENRQDYLGWIYIPTPTNQVNLDDDDDISSVGSGGISKYKRSCRAIPSLGYWPERFQI